MVAKVQLASREKRHGPALAASKGLPHAGVDSMVPPEPVEILAQPRFRPDFARVAVHATTGLRLAREPDPAAPGWSDAPTHGRNVGETTVDEQGKARPRSGAGRGPNPQEANVGPGPEICRNLLEPGAPLEAMGRFAPGLGQ